MEYHNLVIDFANRTKKNLEFIEQYKDLPDCPVYEVTQLVNSLLGLLVFPREHFIDHIPKTPLSDLIRNGWPDIKVLQGYPPCDNLHDLVRLLRNGIAHFNIEFSTNGSLDITGIRLWNDYRGKKTWESHLSISDLKLITDKFIGLINEIDRKQVLDGQQKHNSINNG